MDMFSNVKFHENSGGRIKQIEHTCILCKVRYVNSFVNSETNFVKSLAEIPVPWDKLILVNCLCSFMPSFDIRDCLIAFKNGV